MEYFNPHGSEISLTTSEHDGTYGSYSGTFAARQCQVCAALVDATQIERHAEWHQGVSNANS